MKVVVIGGGAWGTALGQAAALAGNSVTVLARDAVVVEAINQAHKNPAYLGEISLSEQLGATDFVNPNDIDGSFVEYMQDTFSGGPDYSFECIGNTHVMRDALECTHMPFWPRKKS